jgi:ribosomal subunit interface protein
MIQRFALLGLHTEVDNEVQTYVKEKLAKLDRYIPKHGRNSAQLEIRLWKEKISGKTQAVCEATLHMPRRVISLKEHANTFFAAVDAMKTRLKLLIQKYKDKFTDNKRRRHLTARFRRRMPLTAPAASAYTLPT